MIIEAIASASSIDAAKDKAFAALNAPENAEIEFEIIDLPEKKTFGLFGGKDAKVRAFYDDGKQPEIKKTEPRKNTSKKPQPKKVEKERPSSKANNDDVEKTVSYIQSIVDNMELGDVKIEISDIEDGFCLTFKEGDLGAIIGHRGETLDALQHLASLCFNNDKDSFVRVVLDCNNYRAKREKTLAELAVRVAKQAQESNKCQSLEPMNPYERRVIHTAVQEIEGISSWSITNGKTRRVIIGPVEMEGKNVPRHSQRRGDNRGMKRNRGPKRPSQRVDAVPTRDKLTDSEDLPLFGRIN